MATRADRLLCCAVAYHEYVEDATSSSALPTHFANENDAVDAMMRVLWFEAQRSMKKTIPKPEDPYLHPVDIDSSEPGIVTSHVKPDILRRKTPLPNVIYDSRPSHHIASRPSISVRHVAPPVSREEALRSAVQRDAKVAAETERQARREAKADAKSLDSIATRLEKKRQRDNETPDERQARLQEQRAKRAQNKLVKMEQEAAAALNAQADVPMEAREAQAAADGAAEEAGAAASEDADNDDAKVVTDVDKALQMDTSVEVDADYRLPPRIRARSSKLVFFPSPIPFDRHLSALEVVGLHDRIRNAVLCATPSSHVRIVHGPPGTGKTRHLATMINDFGNDRILACAPTNVGAANLYRRIIDHCDDASLLMPISRVPTDTPIISQSPHARVVCCTISSRAGRVLHDEQFGVVIVDEAAQCMEAWMWCLLRPEVHTIVMAGDTHQLPALTSEEGQARQHNRSLMQRLMDAEYPATFLETQHRMHPEIVAFPNRTFYDGRLRTQYDALATFDGRPYEVVDVDGECAELGTSFCNESEVARCMQLQTELSDAFGHVVIISPYQAQTRALLAAGARNVHTIDSFQGHEADAIILSVVRQETIGFWSDYRRLNVALTRARHCMRVVGSVRRWTGLLKQLADDANTRSLVVT